MSDFWKCVIAQPVTDDPAGDFIEDTKALVKRGGNPEQAIVGGCHEARQSHRRLFKQWEAES